MTEQELQNRLVFIQGILKWDKYDVWFFKKAVKGVRAFARCLKLVSAK